MPERAAAGGRRRRHDDARRRGRTPAAAASTAKPRTSRRRSTSEASLHDHLAAQLDLATVDPAERLIGRHHRRCGERGRLPRPRPSTTSPIVSAPSPRPSSACCGSSRASSPQASRRATSPSAWRSSSGSEPLRPGDGRRLVGRLDLVAKRDLPALKRLCGVDDEDLGRHAAPRSAPSTRSRGAPSRAARCRSWSRTCSCVRLPTAAGSSSSTPDTLPRVLMNQSYYAKVSRTLSKDADKAFITECLQTANWLTRSLEQRAKTILKVASEIVRQQDGFFANGVAHLRPLNLKTIADAIGMHESTVSRVTSNKSIGTNRGTFEMKYFFTAAIPGAAGRRGPLLRGGAAPHPAAHRGRRRRASCPTTPSSRSSARGRRHRPPDRRQVPGIVADSVLDRTPARERRRCARRRPARPPWTWQAPLPNPHPKASSGRRAVTRSPRGPRHQSGRPRANREPGRRRTGGTTMGLRVSGKNLDVGEALRSPGREPRRRARSASTSTATIPAT